MNMIKGGADPDHMDKVSMENAYDVTSSESLRELLMGWDREVTVWLMKVSISYSFMC
jgi:hypothetical protein